MKAPTDQTCLTLWPAVKAICSLAMKSSKRMCVGTGRVSAGSPSESARNINAKADGMNALSRPPFVLLNFAYRSLPVIAQDKADVGAAGFAVRVEKSDLRLGIAQIQTDVEVLAQGKVDAPIEPDSQVGVVVGLII